MSSFQPKLPKRRQIEVKYKEEDVIKDRERRQYDKREDQDEGGDKWRTNVLQP